MIGAFDWVREIEAAHLAGQRHQMGVDAWNELTPEELEPLHLAARRFAEFTAQEIAEALAASMARMDEIADLGGGKKWGKGPRQ